MINQEENKILYKWLVEKIEQQIIDRKLKFGDKLPSENALAQQYNISRVTVRQALRLLVEMGLVETRKGIGTFVAMDADKNAENTTFSSFAQKFEDNFNQAIKVKILIEPDIARYVAEKATYNDISKMDSLLNQMNQAESKKKYNDTCTEFHLAVIKAVNNPTLLEFYKKLEEMEKMYLRDLLLSPEISRKMRTTDIEQHGKILQAIKNKKPKKAYLYTLEHLEYVYENYKDIIDDSPEEDRFF